MVKSPLKSILFSLVLCPSVLAAQDANGIVDRLRDAAAASESDRRYLTQLDRSIPAGRKDHELQRALRQLFSVAPTGQLTQADLAENQARLAASARARLLGQYLANDLDGDAQISAEEKTAVSGTQLPEVIILFERADQDRDGRLTFEELWNDASSQSSNDQQPPQQYLMLFDANQDGTVHAQEVIETLNAIEAEPLNLSSSTRSILQLSPARPTCNVPAAPDGAEIIVLSAYEGTALSTVSVAGLNDVTHVGSIVIEDGERPIYLMIGSHSSMIWEVSGATDRITHMVVQKGRRQNGAGPGAGVVGLDAERVHFFDPGTCINGYVKIDEAEGRRTYTTLESHFDRAPDAMLSFYSVAEVALPSGTGRAEQGDGNDIFNYNGRRYEMGPDGPRLLDESEGQLPDGYPRGASLTYRSMLRFSPDGIRVMDPGKVVADRPVVEYDVFPQQAGLLQLLMEGKVTYSQDGAYVIQQPIPRFPAGLFGAHSVRFRLAAGLELPLGQVGHSSVVSEETGECLTRMCR